MVCPGHQWGDWAEWLDLYVAGGKVVRASNRNCLICKCFQFRFEPTERTHSYSDQSL